MGSKISVVINTLNEEENLSYALRSVRAWADEIIVVDMYSEDRTIEIARGFGAKIFFHRKTGFADPARSFAIAQATGDWILILDADELVPAPLSQKLLEVAANDEADVVVISRLNYLLGMPLMHTGWGPKQDRHARFFKQGMLQTTDRIHDFLKPSPVARVLELPHRSGWALVHFNYLDTVHFLEKLNRYTTIEAQQALDRGERAAPWRALFRTSGEFVKRYFWRKGYRDGWRGWYLSGLMALYRWVTYAKLQELQEAGAREAVVKSYHQLAEQIIAGYQMEADNESGC